ncbi:MAG: four helix bundle protein [Acidobacteria bacterium]|nr:four helix bundle protein [Acidobacteriota bacterium]
MGSQSYRDLTVWQKSIALCVMVYQICDGFPKSEMYSLADQMKRAAVSVASNIAEGQGRHHVKEFIHFVSVANGSLAELDTQRIIAEQLRFISIERSATLGEQITEAQKMLYALAAKLKSSAWKLKTEN